PAEATQWLLQWELTLPDDLLDYVPVPTTPTTRTGEDLQQSNSSGAESKLQELAPAEAAHRGKLLRRLVFKDSTGQFKWFDPNKATWFHSKLQEGGISFDNLCRLPNGRWLLYQDNEDFGTLVRAQELTNEQAITLMLAWG